MAEFEQTYLLNASPVTTVAENTATMLDPIALTAAAIEIMTLSGFVYNLTSSGDVPISSATVTVYDSSGAPLASAVTSTTGAFSVSFNGQRNTNYTVVASATGYYSNYDTVTFTSTSQATIFLILPAGGSVNTIYGRVVDASGAGIGGVNIDITDGTNSVYVTTMSDGYFVAYDSFVSGGTYAITASKLGYIQRTQQVTFPTNKIGIEVTFTLDANSSDYTALIGRVVVVGDDAVVSGVQSAFVALFLVSDTSEETLVATQFTDQYGYYAFTDIAGGSQYLVRATKIEEVLS